jgi:hypothetical protein
MTDQAKSPEGTTPNPVDTETAKGKDSVPDTIAYDKYRELLDEKKKIGSQFAETKAALDKLLSEKEEHERKAMEEKQEYKKLYEDEQKRVKKAFAILELKEKEEIESKKLAAFTEKIGGLRKAEYKKFIDLESIPFNDGKIDDRALEEYAINFKTQFPELVKENAKTPPPASAPSSGGTTIAGNKMSSDDLLRLYKEQRLASIK